MAVGSWPGLSPGPWGTRRALFLSLSAHRPYKHPLHLGSKASPRVLGPRATIGRAAQGILDTVEPKKPCEAPKHTQQAFLQQLPPLRGLGRVPRVDQFPGSSSTNGWHLLDPQHNGKFYHPPLHNVGSPVEREGCRPLACSLLCWYQHGNATEHTILSSAAHTTSGVGCGLAGGLGSAGACASG